MPPYQHEQHEQQHKRHDKSTWSWLLTEISFSCSYQGALLTNHNKITISDFWHEKTIIGISVVTKEAEKRHISRYFQIVKKVIF